MAHTPAAVIRTEAQIGRHLATWRRLRRLTASEVADRAGVSVATVSRIERGSGASLENVLRVSRALGVMDPFAAALDPYTTEVGQLRAEEALPKRVRAS